MNGKINPVLKENVSSTKRDEEICKQKYSADNARELKFNQNTLLFQVL